LIGTLRAGTPQQLLQHAVATRVTDCIRDAFRNSERWLLARIQQSSHVLTWADEATGITVAFTYVLVYEDLVTEEPIVFQVAGGALQQSRHAAVITDMLSGLYEYYFPANLFPLYWLMTSSPIVLHTFQRSHARMPGVFYFPTQHSAEELAKRQEVAPMCRALLASRGMTPMSREHFWITRLNKPLSFFTPQWNQTLANFPRVPLAMTPMGDPEWHMVLIVCDRRGPAAALGRPLHVPPIPTPLCFD